MILFNIRTTLLIVLVVTVVVSSSTTVATADAGTHGRFLFLSQTLPDNSQSIIKRIGELQKQIDELRRQIQTLPTDPPGPPGAPDSTKNLVSEVVTTSINTEHNAVTQITATCPNGKILSGGGFAIRETDPIEVDYSGPGPGSSWLVKVFVSGSGEPPLPAKAFAVCASLE